MFVFIINLFFSNLILAWKKCIKVNIMLEYEPINLFKLLFHDIEYMTQRLCCVYKNLSVHLCYLLPLLTDQGNIKARLISFACQRKWRQQHLVLIKICRYLFIYIIIGGWKIHKQLTRKKLQCIDQKGFPVHKMLYLVHMLNNYKRKRKKEKYNENIFNNCVFCL